MSGNDFTQGNSGSDLSPNFPSRAFKSAFSLDPKFFMDLHARLETERQRANEQHTSILTWLKSSIQPPEGYSVTVNSTEILFAPETIPPAEQLAELVQTAFWASLEREEGRDLHFRVNFMQPEPDGERLILFEHPLPYDVRTLTKLAPAVGTGKAALLVAPFEGGHLKVWGLRDGTQAPVSVKGIDPGSVIVKFKETNVAAISRSEAVHIRDPLLTRSSVLWSRFEPNEEGVEYDQWKDPRINAILETVKRMRSLGHGGTLVIVPPASCWQDSVKTPITYSGPTPYSPFRESILRLKDLVGKPGHTMAEEMFWWALVTESCRTLARLTAVDGATIITYDLDVLGFGAKLQPSLGSAEPQRVFSVDPLDHESWITPVEMGQLGGTRHQSAARFVSDQRDAIAFVVSQDGDVSAFACWQPPAYKVPALYAHRRLELTLF